MLRRVAILLGWGWVLLNGAAYTLAEPYGLAQLNPVTQVSPAFDRQVAALALLPTIPGLDGQASVIVHVLAGVILALLGHAWPVGKPASRAKVAAGGEYRRRRDAAGCGAATSAFYGLRRCRAARPRGGVSIPPRSKILPIPGVCSSWARTSEPWPGA
jgi:hypothetical protein